MATLAHPMCSLFMNVSQLHVVMHELWGRPLYLGGPRGLSKSVISRVIIKVTPFRVLITLLITYLLSPLGLQVRTAANSRSAVRSSTVISAASAAHAFRPLKLGFRCLAL